MQISIGKSSTDLKANQHQIGSTLIAVVPDGAISFKCGTATVYLSGEFYYCARQGGVDYLNQAGDACELQRIFERVGPDTFPRVVEGMYFGIWIDELSGCAQIFADSLNRRPVYIISTDKEMLVTDSFPCARASAGKTKINQLSLYNYMLLGYTAIADTLYDKINRLSSDEKIIIKNDGARREKCSHNVSIREYDKSDINRYESLILDSVHSRASANENIVMNSGGWDSTALVYLLTEHLGKDRVRSIVFDVHLSDGKSFNVYEVDKVQRLSRHFGIKSETCVVDYASNTSVDAWERAIPTLRNNNTYFWLHHMKLAEQIASGASAGASVFSGEASDSVHNFGFSQFVSVNYQNMALREYADKAKSYLYGPTFMRSIMDGTCLDDKVFSFFRSYYGEDKIDDPSQMESEDKLYRYLEALVFSYPRVPFARWQNGTLAKEKLQKAFSGYIRDKYFRRSIREMTSDNLYYHLLQTYRDFHFQSAQMGVANVALSSHGLSCKIPFLDSRIMDYMYSMPENWGRGLELKTTKYPLRYLATERWNMPLHILEEAGPHSYIAETDKEWTYSGGQWDIYCEILFKSVFSTYFRDSLKNVRIEDVFDAQFFDVPFIQKVLTDYVGGKDDVPNRGLLYKLALLFTIGIAS
jgi:hypothetical protein